MARINYQNRKKYLRKRSERDLKRANLRELRFYLAVQLRKAKQAELLGQVGQ